MVRKKSVNLDDEEEEAEEKNKKFGPEFNEDELEK